MIVMKDCSVLISIACMSKLVFVWMLRNGMCVCMYVQTPPLLLSSGASGVSFLIML